MEYKRFNNTIIVRFDIGDEIVEKVKELGLKENIKLANVSALGATDYFVAGVYSVPEKKYYKNEFKGVYEITNITGTINTMDGEFYSHLHITCADQNGACFGGHLNSAKVSATCEMVITIIEGTVDRFHDETTGLNLFKF